jgi:CspA family cold shock protein
MRSRGEVRVWHADEGWGVIDCPDTPGGCWAGFPAVLVAGHQALDAGALVELIYEAAEQDGYSFRAVEVWPAGQAPVRQHPRATGPSAAYRSTLTLTFDDEGESP